MRSTRQTNARHCCRVQRRGASFCSGTKSRMARCRAVPDCFLPSFGYRPGNSVQYALAIRNFDNADKPTRLNWGFIASSDNHRARPGTGYKNVDRTRTQRRCILRRMAQAVSRWRPKAVSRWFWSAMNYERGFGATEQERQASFWTTGGLAAVHAEGRSREEIFDAISAAKLTAQAVCVFCFGSTPKTVCRWAARPSAMARRF